MTLRVLDLYSGLGGFSEAFLLAGDTVQRVENNPLLSEVPETHSMCVLQLRDELVHRKEEGLLDEYQWANIDVLLSAPPCREFSLAYSAPRAKAHRNNEHFEPNMEHLEATLEILQIVRPRYFIIENVVGSIKYFEEYGLTNYQIHGAHVFYGKFPFFSTPDDLPSKASKDTWSSDPLRVNKKALIPLELSMALRQAILSQRTLWEFV